MKNTIRTLLTVFATMCLGIILLIPFVNLYLLKEVIYQETLIKTDYWKRPLGSKPKLKRNTKQS
ncbi:hypothetical protein LCGC14_1678930 [marine sediment metagenome]|uniref:Uncharacterized protein n=1 Tax=marine sediment metagenome TaxID=412755 RepID=A0A0F9HPR1_9ZZZZ